MIKAIVVLMLLGVFGSLLSALVFLYKDTGSSRRTAKALTLRIVLSITLFFMLMAGFYFGIIPAGGL